MSVQLCIHGHFYQPPREDPWLGVILAEPSAAPMRHWNERILRESYAPLAWARRLDAEGRILDLVNCYEWMSFNAGPTLLRWMRRVCPELVARLVEADRKSLERWGHGNAMAQIYHHVIMPLASAEDKALEIKWAIDDFRHYFGRDPEGMWLSECAVDLATLDCLADQGIGFVILAPRQARAVVTEDGQVPVDEGTLNIGEPYKVSLPSGKSISVVFYNGSLSQGIAFEGLLRNGETFWNRIREEASSLASLGQDHPLLTIATDGETYGHHFTFGEMALAYVLCQGAKRRDNIRLTNLAAYIADNPPIREILLHEPSSWSCVHGVERWRSNCGCTDGGHQGWNQQWRAPLRAALDVMRAAVTKHFYTVGHDVFTDPAGALAAYGEVLANPDRRDDFAAQWLTGDAERHDVAFRLLAMQEQALAAYASCAWFFDDLARIEPENAMTFALRAMELMLDTGGPDMQEEFSAQLAKAQSNMMGMGTGADVFAKDVLPRRDDAATLCLLAWVLLVSNGQEPEVDRPVTYRWPEVSVEFLASGPEQGGEQKGTAVIRVANESSGKRYSWRIKAPSRSVEDRNTFITLAESAIHVRPEGAPPGQEIPRSIADFSHPMREALTTACLENWECGVRDELSTIARHAVSMVAPFVDGQSDVIRPEFWLGFVPHLVVQSMMDDSLSPRLRRQIEVILSLHLNTRAKMLAQEIVRDAFDEAFAGKHGPVTDETLATWVQRVRFVMPDMDWWSVQNKVWDRGLDSYPLLAKELGFK